MKIDTLLRNLPILLCPFLIFSCKSISSEVNTVSNVDGKRYMGLWYEIARFDTYFQKGKYNSMAHYVLNSDGTISITNSATDKNGKSVSASAVGYAPNIKDFSKLRISFFRPFYSDYFILELDDDYKWALVGGKSKKYLWILSRTPNIDKETLNKIILLAKKRGYDISKLLFNSKIVSE